MTEPIDPPRLRDASEPRLTGLRDLMQAAEQDVGSDAQVARMATRLGAVLAPPVAVAAGAGAAGLGTAAKAGLGAVALIVAGGGAWLLSTAQPAPPPVPTHGPPAVAAPLSPPTPSPEPVVAPPAAPSPAQADVAEPPPPTSPKRADKPAPPPALSEAELLEQARSALKGDPARALARANQHAARFPGGALVQEREVIAIKALRQLGRTAEADRRSEAFAKAFPGSAFGRKLKPTP
jgi:hypothetical protein